MPSFVFWVEGTPVPKGSLIPVPFFNKRRKRWDAYLREDNAETKPWMKTVAAAAVAAGVRVERLGAVEVNCKFYFPRPKYHLRANGSLRPDAPRLHIVKPDKDKLERAILDALKRIGFHDDCVVARGWQEKVYVLPGERPGAHIELLEAHDRTASGQTSLALDAA